MWSFKIILRYILLQTPAVLLLAGLNVYAHITGVLPAGLLLWILILWLVKDIVL